MNSFTSFISEDENSYNKFLEKNNLEGKNFSIRKKENEVQTEIILYKKDDVINEIKNYLSSILDPLNSNTTIDVKYNEYRILVEISTEEKSILIGKNGLVIKSLEILVKQYLIVQYGINEKLNIDIENYRKNQENRILKIAIDCANDVLKTSIPIELDSMTSYERKIVHDELGKMDGIITISKGEVPNRYIVIKKDEKNSKKEII